MKQVTEPRVCCQTGCQTVKTLSDAQQGSSSNDHARYGMRIKRERKYHGTYVLNEHLLEAAEILYCTPYWYIRVPYTAVTGA